MRTPIAFYINLQTNVEKKSKEEENQNNYTPSVLSFIN